MKVLEKKNDKIIFKNKSKKKKKLKKRKIWLKKLKLMLAKYYRQPFCKIYFTKNK